MRQDSAKRLANSKAQSDALLSKLTGKPATRFDGSSRAYKVQVPDKQGVLRWITFKQESGRAAYEHFDKLGLLDVLDVKKATLEKDAAKRPPNTTYSSHAKVFDAALRKAIKAGLAKPV